MMKFKVNSSQANVQQCTYCSGLDTRVDRASVDTCKSCSTCKHLTKEKDVKQKSVEKDILPQKISVVEVGKKTNSSEKICKTPSLFGRLFSKTDKETKLENYSGGADLEITTSIDFSLKLPQQFQPPVTLLEIKNSPKLTSSNPNLDQTLPVCDAFSDHSNDDTCTICCSNPAQFSVTESKGGKTERLCNFCRVQRTNKSAIKHFMLTDSLNLDSATAKRSVKGKTNKTIIVVNDGINLLKTNPLSQDEKKPNFRNPEKRDEKLLQILEDLKNTVLNSSCNDLKTTDQSTHSQMANVASKTLIEQNRIFSTKLDPEQRENEGLPVTVMSIHNNNILKRSNTTGCDVTPPFQKNQTCSSEGRAVEMRFELPVEGEITGEFERPSPYNPDYRSTLGKASVASFRMPSELEVVGPYRGMPSDQSKVEEYLFTERSKSSFNHLDGGFPSLRQNETISKSNSIDQSSQRVNLLRCFGTFSDISTHPGGFTNPATLKLYKNSQDRATDERQDSGMFVVTDRELSNVQVFDTKGNCLSLVKIKNIKSCCPIAARQLVVATDDWLAILDYNGTEKARTLLDADKGALNSISPYKNRTSFVVVAQAKMVSIFDCKSSIVLLRRVDRVNKKVRFENIVDATITSKENLVVLDAGAGDRSGAIFVIDITTGLPKSAIYPGLETCGSLMNPTAIAVDRRNQILVADAGNLRVLLFSNARTTGSVSTRNEIHFKTLNGLDLLGPAGNDLRPAGMDVNDDDLIFLAVKGENKAGIRIYSCR